MDDQQDPFEARQAWLDRLDAANETAESEASLDLGRYSFDLGRRPRGCGIHGDPTDSGRCATCDAERDRRSEE